MQCSDVTIISLFRAPCLYKVNKCRFQEPGINVRIFVTNYAVKPMSCYFKAE